MLTEKDLDYLKYCILNNKDAYVYYIAHMVETRETIIDKSNYKDISKFKIIKLKVADVNNAYFEYLKYLSNKSDYHIEEEESYYNIGTRCKHITYYNIPNSSKEYEPKIPSIVFGNNIKIYDENDNLVLDIQDPSLIKHRFINRQDFSFMDYDEDKINSSFILHKLDWKYKALIDPEICDGIEYQYITSDWYILDIKNFNTTEKPLVNINKKSAYFLDIDDAFSYMQELNA